MRRWTSRRLRLLLELSRSESMREVADELGTTTSTVSQAIAALAREVGTALVEPDGRRVRLTPAGQRLAEHAITILAAVDAARLDLDPDAEPHGTLRVAGFATADPPLAAAGRRRAGATHPGIADPDPRARAAARPSTCSRATTVDLALTYDYDLAPAAWPSDLDVTPLWSTEWGLGVPADEPRAPTSRRTPTTTGS